MRFVLKSSGKFQSQLQARIEKWSAEKAVGARLHAPEELKWWLWQEYGVPGHEIVPVESTMLAFPGEGGTELRDRVDWPGIKPHHTVATSLDDIRNNADQLVQQALQNGGADRPELVQEALMEAVRDGKAIIVGAMTGDLPGTRPDNPEYPKQSGKLHGETAASVFDSLAEVLPIDE